MMKKKILTMMSVVALTAAVTMNSCMSNERENPFLKSYETPFNIPPFAEITYDDYLPAFEQGVAEYKADIQAIIANEEAPTFENTILAMEKSGDLLNRVLLVFSSLNETDSSDEMVALSDTIMPMATKISDEVMMNDSLFQRVKVVYENKDSLSATEKRAVDALYTRFVRNGALLSEADKATLKELNTKSADLYLAFNKNLLNATNAFELWVEDAAQLAGLPESTIAVAAEEAKAKGKEGKWLFTLHAPSRLPLLQYADNRDLRRQMYEGYTNLASAGENNNVPVINEILKVRSQKAALLGYPDFASYMTANVMAKTTANAEGLLMQIWEPAIEKVKEEVAEMQALADKEGANIKIEPWDYYYYAEKVRRDKYALDENEVRAYFQLDNVVEGIFNLASRLYGVKFTELPDAPKYNPEVKVYEVTDTLGNHVAIFMTDYFPRASKRQGAWMSEFQGAFVDPDGTSQRPIVYNVGNFTKPTAEMPSLLTIDEVLTVFHEFGHGLHGMLTKAHLRSQAGTNVDRDFVELPSQIHEHWAFEPELLKSYARHYKTGEVISDELIAKLTAAGTHNQGFMTTELVGAALLDLQYGKQNVTGDFDVMAFEAKVAQDLKMPAEVQFRYRSPYFRHIFGSDGYASGYYTYLWAQVLDCDAYELFQEKGIFDVETANSFKTNVLEAGGTEDPMTLYVKFRGHEPKVDALLRYRGLAPVK